MKHQTRKTRKLALSLFLIFAALAALVSCGSGAYKKAKALYDSGDYAAAKEAFIALGDYQDSKTFAQKCDYQIATDLLKNGQYAEAREIFDRLGDFEDSALFLTKAKWAMLYDYIQANGKSETEVFKIEKWISIPLSESVKRPIGVEMPDPETIILHNRLVSLTTGIGTAEDMKVTLKVGDDTAQWSFTSMWALKLGSASMTNAETGSGTFRTGEVKRDETLTPDTYKETTTGTKADGTPIDESTTDVSEMSYKPSERWAEIASSVNALLDLASCDLSAQDLGFTNL